MMVFSDALHTWDAAKAQLEESKLEYLAAKDFGNPSSMFTASVVLAEAFCSAEEAREVFEGIVEDMNWQTIQDERTERLLERRG